MLASFRAFAVISDLLLGDRFPSITKSTSFAPAAFAAQTKLLAVARLALSHPIQATTELVRRRLTNRNVIHDYSSRSCQSSGLPSSPRESQYASVLGLH